MASVLVIEDEALFGTAIVRFLETEGYEVTLGLTAEEGLRLFAERQPDAILLDLRLPDSDGFDVCREIRTHSDVPIIILSARDNEMDKVIGLELGADDYATKDMSLRELLARIRAVTRRSGPNEAIGSLTEVGEHTVDRLARAVTTEEGTAVDLTQLEFDLLLYFLDQPGVALPREQIFNDVWHQADLGSSRTIDAHVVSLRGKIPDLTVSAIRGVGYRFEGTDISRRVKRKSKLREAE